MDYKIESPNILNTAHKITLPLSKSVCNRVQIIEAIRVGGKKPMLTNMSTPNDIRIMHKALAKGEGRIDIEDCGTAMRFLTAYFATKKGSYAILDGTPRMRERPIGKLVDALRFFGADIEYLRKDGYPPLKIHGKKLCGGSIEMTGESSQFISALLLVAPQLGAPLKINWSVYQKSTSYIFLTASLMRKAGAELLIKENEIEANNSPYVRNAFMRIEKDWTAASYWYSLCAITHQPIEIKYLRESDAQGDKDLLNIFFNLGVNTIFTKEGIRLEYNNNWEVPHLRVDFSNNPDLAQTVMATCVAMGISFNFTGLESLRIKETDRLSAMQNELRKLGAEIVVENEECVSWDGNIGNSQGSPIIETYGDHRMAMAFAAISPNFPGMTIKNAEVVNKSYPGFWKEMQALGFSLS